MSKSRLWLGIEIILLAVLLVLIGFFIKRKIDDREYLARQEKVQTEIQGSLEETTKETGIDLSKPEGENWIEKRNQAAINQVEKIREKTPSVIGIIEIPNTNFLYEIVQGEDNQFYLDHDKNGNYHPFGEVYLDSRNQKDFTDKNSVIYGHNVIQAKTIFHELLKYRDQEFYESHKEINLYTLGGFKSYEVKNVFYASPEEPYRERDFGSESDFVEFVDKYIDDNMIETKLSDENIENKKLITLSTCFDDNRRLVIQAIEKIEDL